MPGKKIILTIMKIAGKFLFAYLFRRIYILFFRRIYTFYFTPLKKLCSNHSLNVYHPVDQAEETLLFSNRFITLKPIGVSFTSHNLAQFSDQLNDQYKPFNKIRSHLLLHDTLVFSIFNLPYNVKVGPKFNVGISRTEYLKCCSDSKPATEQTALHRVL